MKNIVDLTIGFCAGTDISEAVENAYKIVHKLKMPVKFDFNGVSVWLEPKDSVGCSFDVE